MTHFYSSPDQFPSVHRDLAPNEFGHPDDVLLDQCLSAQEKRTLLASWASDANAVPDLPTMRQLPDGSIVKVEEILCALSILDASGEAEHIQAPSTPLWQWSFDRRRVRPLRTWPRNKRGSGNDDDPPPCPAYATVRPRSGGGAAVAYPDPVMA
jgi:hypothetical protein